MSNLKIIAEIGINHNGDIKIAEDLINMAHRCGADIVKFQKRDIDQVYEQDFLNSSRESPWGKTQRDQKKGLEFENSEYDFIDTYCKELGIKWFASAWDLNSLKFLNNYNLEFNKIASAMIVYDDFLKEVASTGKKCFISTGMSSYEEIDNAVNIFTQKKCEFELMHCISTYPMNDEDANLLCIPDLRKRYNCDVGYSGHEVGLAVSYAAVALGATSLERHITLDRAMYGSDQASSIEESGFKQLCGAVRKIEKALGDGKKKILDEEVPISKKLRAHIPWESNS